MASGAQQWPSRAHAPHAYSRDRAPRGRPPRNDALVKGSTPCSPPSTHTSHRASEPPESDYPTRHLENTVARLKAGPTLFSYTGLFHWLAGREEQGRRAKAESTPGLAVRRCARESVRQGQGVPTPQSSKLGTMIYFVSCGHRRGLLYCWA